MGSLRIATLATLVWCLGLDAARAAGDRAFGEYLSAECVTCHRAGAQQGIPSIFGMPPATFIDLLSQYRQKQRANPIMQTIASRLTDDEMAALAAYFSSLPAR